MNTAQRTAQEQYTILRIKRKRNEEPLDALVVESSAKRKKAKSGVNVFQFAETVEQEAWEDEKQKQDLQTRISNLARESSKKIAQPATLPASASAPSETSVDTTDSPEAKVPRKLPQIDDPSRKYMIVPTGSSESISKASRRPTTPPKVHSYKELQKASFTMYDAIPSSTSLATSSGSDPDMDKFLPMLQDYLRLNDADSSLASSSSRSIAAGEDSDYVWDVFYSRPATFRELYGSNTNIGMVTGLPDDDLYGSGSDSECEDEDDEDSNAEDWYKNDYPDEESASGEEDANVESDGSGDYMFHDGSGSEDVQDHSGRLWDYR